MASNSVAHQRALSNGRATSRLLHSAFAAHHAITQQEGVHVGIGQPRADTFDSHVRFSQELGEPSMDAILRLFIQRGYNISCDRSLHFPLVHFLVFAGKVDILELAMRRFSYVPRIEDGLLQFTLASGNVFTLRYVVQRFPIELVGNPFSPFKFRNCPHLRIGFVWNKSTYMSAK